MARRLSGAAHRRQKGDMTGLHVVLVTGADGTQSIVGTKAGRPFSSDVSAQKVADRYAADSSVAATVELIERRD